MSLSRYPFPPPPRLPLSLVSCRTKDDARDDNAGDVKPNFVHPRYGRENVDRVDGVPDDGSELCEQEPDQKLAHGADKAGAFAYEAVVGRTKGRNQPRDRN